jgi:hypothetical protein
MPIYQNILVPKGIPLDGNGGVVLVNSQFEIYFPQSCTIVGWYISAKGTNPTATFDVWIVPPGGTALPTVANTIFSGTKPALATGNIIDSTDLSGFIAASLSVAAGSTGIVNLDAVTAATQLLFLLKTV